MFLFVLLSCSCYRERKEFFLKWNNNTCVILVHILCHLCFQNTTENQYLEVTFNLVHKVVSLVHFQYFFWPFHTVDSIA